MSIIENTPQTAFDILDYIPGDRGMPRWVYVEPSRVSIEFTQDTKTLCVWWDHRNRNAAGNGRVTDNIEAFNEYARVLGEVYKSFYRKPEWPKNLFYYIPDPDVLEQNVAIEGWAADRVGVDLPDVEVPAVNLFEAPANRAFVMEQLNRFAEDSPLASDPIDAPDALATLRTPDALLNRWVFWDPSIEHATLSAESLAGDTLVTVHPEEDAPIDREGLFDPVWLTQGHVPYFRRAYWPDGLFRIAGIIRFGDGEGPRAYQVPCFSNEPPANAEALSIRRPAVSYPTAEHFIGGRIGLATLLAQPGRRIRSTHWILWDMGSEISDASLHLTPTGSTYSVSDAIEGIVKSSEPGIITLYRYKHWPSHTWSAVWDGEETFFKEDAFGPFQDEQSDTSTHQAPVTDRQEFQFPKWIKPVWHSTLSVASDKRYIVVNISHNRATVGSMGDHHPITYWTDTDQPKKAVYFRERSFPAGVYRRLDRHSLSVRAGRIRIATYVHQDEPCHTTAPAPWYSERLAQWVERMSERLGRPIHSHPDQGTPFLSVEDPGHNRGSAGFRFTFGGAEMQAQSSMHVHIDEGDNITNLTCDNNQIYWGSKYRTGIKLHFDPHMLHYVEGQEGVEGHPLDAILSSFEEFFATYEDPDITEELSEQVWNRVANRVNRFDNDVERAKQSIRSKQEHLDAAVQHLQSLYERRSFFADLSQAKFRSILRRNRRLIERQGSLTFDGNMIKLKVDPFEIQGQPIGPLMVSMTLNETAFRVKVTSTNSEQSQANLSQQGYCHPHVDSRSHRICWGTGGNIAAELANGFDPLEYLFATVQFLKEGYHAEGAYVRIDQWRPRQVWWCEHCEADHPNGEDCPHLCRHCGEYVDMDEHEHCSDHRVCWNNLDDDDCPRCAEASEQAEQQAS